MPKPTAYRGKRIAPLLAAAGQQAADATTPDWANIQNIPAEFPPEAHTHTPSEVGLASITDDGVTVSIAVKLQALGGAVSVTGARNDPEQALKTLLQKLEDIGLINDTTTAV